MTSTSGLEVVSLSEGLIFTSSLFSFCSIVYGGAESRWLEMEAGIESSGGGRTLVWFSLLSGVLDGLIAYD